MKKISAILTLLSIAVLSFHCTSASVSSPAPTIVDHGITESDFPNETHVDDEGVPAEENRSTPVAHFPTPPSALTSDKILAFAQDSENRHVILGLPDAAASDDESQLVIANQPIALESQNTKTICQQKNITCCPIQADGSFECVNQFDSLESAQVSLAVLDKNQNLSQSIQEPVVSHALKLHNLPYSLHKGARQKVLGLSGQDGIVLKFKNKGYHLEGDYHQNYRHFLTEGSELAIDGPIMAMRHPQDGILMYSYRPAGNQFEDLNLRVRFNDFETEKYLKLKLADKKISFIAQPRSPEMFGMIGQIILRDDEVQPRPFHLQFLWQAQGDKRLTNIFAFDVDDSHYALVVYQNQGGETLLRMANRDNHRHPLVGEVKLPLSNYQFKDIKIYQQNTTKDKPGRALLLDTKLSRAGLIEFNHRLNKNRYVKMLGWIPLGNNQEVVDFTLNDTKDRAYFIAKTNGSLMSLILNHASLTEIKKSLVTFKLKNFVPDFETNYRPQTIMFDTIKDKPISHRRLLIGLDKLKGILVIDENQLRL